VNGTVIVDYGVGNLRSVAWAVQHAGAEPQVTGDCARVARADRLILPGVGAFGDCMRELAAHGLVDAVRSFASSGRPVLGICVGMQMFFDAGEEFGLHQGLGLVAGRVVPIPRGDARGAGRKVPHIGWSPLVPSGAGAAWDGTLLADVAAGSCVYFVHSFVGVPADPCQRLADTDYEGFAVPAVIRAGNLVGCQFHPEKSGPVGLAILRRFLIT
jgi:glutamine amidotransferase